MPNDSGYVLDFETLQRISKSVREQERGVTKAGMADQSQADQQEGTSFVEVTGAATTAGYYPAREKWYDIESNTWTYAQDPCVAWEMNGSTLDSGKTYKGTLARSVVEGGVVKHVFAVQASGGGGVAAADNGARFVQFTDRAGTFGIYNGFMLTWNSSGVAQGSGVSVFIQAWGTNSLPVVPSAGQYEIALKISDAYTAPGTPGGANITKPLYVVYGQGYPPPSCVVKPTRETTLLGTYYGELSVISGAGLTGITWADTTGREVLIHNINSTGVAGSLTVNKRYMGILSGSSFASGTAFGAQLNGYPIYTVAAP
jgi:hypothetical protein